jgi:DNA-nicking Smr family endonuclease
MTMARKRLYGTTQKRRKKRRTQELKRRDSVSRVQATQQPAPFQRKGELDGHDITFLEAMREMGVTRYRRAGEAPVRLERFERVRFATEQGEQTDFMAAMTSLGVKPLAGKSRADGTAAGSRAASGEAPRSAPAQGKKQVVKKAPAGAGREPEGPAGATEGAAAPARKKSAPATTTRFQWEEGDERLLAEALRKGDFDPADKYEGAPEPAKPAPPETPREDREPDAELDLHGKTQEEAIRMVQNFLLTGHRQKLHEVLIITGKGLNSGEQGPVLREAVQRWLQRNGARFAKSYGPAPARHGGGGAIWVSLR